ncbi:MAG TPA: M14 family zinc carboxypeptidase [Rhodanobacteraceae bacterium]|nr:M14 family zinc carboxypeptidase [Rhodanobacteraceae bacterium]
MRHIRFGVAAIAALVCATALAGTANPYARDPNQPVDQAYAAKIAKYTTQPDFNTPLTDYLPASSTVPTPEAVLGDVAGAPNTLPYAETVYQYFRLLAKATPRVRVYSIGKTEEGREMIAVAIADESLMQDLDANKARLAQLADPRKLGMDDAKAAALIKQTVPVYYITGTIHSTETGAPTALMELVYRLAVDDAPYIKYIRSHTITLITPVVEVDGRDRMVDLYKWHRAHPDENYPHLMYWGHYVAHDNNRDAMAVTLDLTRNVLNTYVGWHAQVLHDLHESVPFLYDNTVGDGPYNAWIDPILTSEWQQIGWNNVEQLTKLGLPGVFTHGDFDTWSPGYLMFIAAMHNGISRLYETFGNGGADTEERILSPDEYARTWYKPNPPLPKVLWSQRDNNNYEQSGLLTSLYYFAQHGQHFLDNFWLKSKRSIEKPQLAGPAAYVLTANEKDKGAQMHLLHALHLQHVEISRANAPFTVAVADDTESGAGGKATSKSAQTTEPPKVATTQRTFPAGSWIIRMDQPYSRIADTLLDRQYWAPDDPQKHPYDDTGWSFGDLFGVDVARVVDTAVLKVPMREVQGDFTQPAFTLASLGVTNTDRMPRIALMHTWLSTQTEGWWRMALDKLHVPYSYISTQDVAREPDLRAKYDVILFGPVGYSSTRMIIDGLPMYGNPMPWEKTALTPNLGRIDSTPDVRPGLGETGVANLKRFVAQGGLLVTSEDTARFAIDIGLAPGVSVAKSGDLRVVGSVLRANLVDKSSAMSAGYRDTFALYSSSGMAFNVADQTIGDRGLATAQDYARPTGRGGPDDADVPEGRPFVQPPALPDVQPWQAVPLNAEQARNNPFVIPAVERPQVIVRWADAGKLLISGLLENGSAMAGHAAVVDARYGKGHVVLFANNPVWRGETIGSYRMFFNAVTHYDGL